MKKTMLVLALLGIAGLADAYTVNVKNKTSGDVEVEARYYDGDTLKFQASALIAGGDTYKFQEQADGLSASLINIVTPNIDARRDLEVKKSGLGKFKCDAHQCEYHS
jgi:hypothetical protein